MFTLKFDIDKVWQSDLISHSDFIAITLIRHPAVQKLVVTTDDAVELSIWESSLPSKRNPHRSQSEKLEDCATAKRRITISLPRTAGKSGRIWFSDRADFFLYASVSNGVLRISFDPKQAAPKDYSIDATLLAAHIYYDPGPSTSTYISGLHRLMPNTDIAFDRSGISIKTLGDFEPVESSPIVVGANAAHAIRDIIAEEIAGHALGTGVIEFSGGVDSSLVGLCAASVEHRPLYTACLIQDGQPGDQQRQRRDEFTSLLKYRDVAVDCRICQPFAASAAAPSKAIGPDIWDSPYFRGTLAWIDALEAYLGHSGGLTVFTGIGGDELYIDTSPDQPEDADEIYKSETASLIPAAAVEALRALPTIGPISAQTAAMGRARIFFARDAIPVNPLCSPEVYTFFQRLPHSARANKAITRRLMAEAGLSDSFIYPHLIEDFSQTFEQSMRDFDFEGFFGPNPLLMEYGVLDVRGLLRWLGSGEVDLIALRALRAEAWLRSIDHRHHVQTSLALESKLNWAQSSYA